MWIRNFTLHTLLFQDELAELGRTRARVYNDGESFVLDLAERASPGAAQWLPQSHAGLLR